MEKIIISRDTYNEIADRSEKNPMEVCGLIFDDNTIHHAENVSKIEGVEYRFSPSDFGLFLQYHTKKRTDKTLISIYHSHPHWKAYPSSVDIANAWKGYVYIIYSCVEHLARAFIVEGENDKKILVEIKLEVVENVSR